MESTSRTKEGVVFVMVGPGGAGKNTMMEFVLSRIQNLSQLATATTRDPRPNEIHGKHHLFVSVEQFQEMIEKNLLVEHQEVHKGKFYGVPRQPIDEALRDGRCLIADIEIEGAKEIRKAYPHNTVLIFVKAPSLEILANRMRGRGENEEGVEKRMKRANIEMAFEPECNFVIVNDVLEEAQARLETFIINTIENRAPKYAVAQV